MLRPNPSRMTPGARTFEGGKREERPTRPHPRRHSLISRAMWLSGRLWTVAGAAALIGLLGHILNLPGLYRPLHVGSAMHPLTAVMILLLWLAERIGDVPRWRRAALATALAVTLITLARLTVPQMARPLFHFHLDAHGPLDELVAFGTNSAAALMSCALAVTLLLRKRPDAAQILALFALMPPLVSLTGYLFHLSDFYGEMSPLATVALFAVALALIGRTARHGVMRGLLSPSATGRIMRIFFIAVSAVLPIFGLILPRLLLGPQATKWLAVNLVIEFAILTAVVLAVTVTLEKQDMRARRATRSMRRESQIDPLTGVWNRRALESRIRELDRTTEPVGVLAIDLDHFKRINDDFGHAVGDNVLREVAALLRGSVRATDIVARTGGEEFVILLPSAKMAIAVSLGEMLRRHVARHRFRALESTPRQVTISVGCAARMGFGRLGPVLDRADQALYAAKNSGRNRVLPGPACEQLDHCPLPGLCRAEHANCQRLLKSQA